ncbi:MAG: hypothetical protein A2066_10940 [Bacteroidetes bacterium GWB2_41_8]|nr:MAG: hypothetical protein A2066_10940 [Bacteroidetes bacterium GWB2_41_8]
MEESIKILKHRNLVISIGLLFMCCISSCDSIERKRNEKAKQDSLNILRNQEFNDSIKWAEKKKNAKIDSLTQYAWGDAKFEMSLNEVKKTKAFNGNYINAFKNDGCMFFVFARSHDDKLYQVEIETHDKTANYMMPIS